MKSLKTNILGGVKVSWNDLGLLNDAIQELSAGFGSLFGYCVLSGCLITPKSGQTPAKNEKGWVIIGGELMEVEANNAITEDLGGNGAGEYKFKIVTSYPSSGNVVAGNNNTPHQIHKFNKAVIVFTNKITGFSKLEKWSKIVASYSDHQDLSNSHTALKNDVGITYLYYDGSGTSVSTHTLVSWNTVTGHLFSGGSIPMKKGSIYKVEVLSGAADLQIEYNLTTELMPTGKTFYIDNTAGVIDLIGEIKYKTNAVFKVVITNMGLKK